MYPSVVAAALLPVMFVFGLELMTEPKQNSKLRLIVVPKLTAVMKPMAEPKLKLRHVLYLAAAEAVALPPVVPVIEPKLMTVPKPNAEPILMSEPKLIAVLKLMAEPKLRCVLHPASAVELLNYSEPGRVPSLPSVPEVAVFGLIGIVASCSQI